MKTTHTYAELEQEMIYKGFTRADVDTLTNWWPNEWNWLYTAASEEIRAASADCLENNNEN